MKKVALVFAHNDLATLDEYLSVVIEYVEKRLPRPVEMVAVVSQSVTDKLAGRYSAVGIMPASHFNAKKFDHVVPCQPLSGETDKKAAVWSFLDKHLKRSSFALSRGLVFESVYNACDGYGGSAQGMMIEFSNKRIPVSFLPLSSSPDSHLIAHPAVKERLSTFPLAAHYLLYAAPVVTRSLGTHLSARADCSIFTMFESTQIPTGWPSIINNFNRLIVPSTFCQEVFINSGVTVPTEVVPLGIIPKEWPVNQDRLKEDRPFRFLLFANSHWQNTRKNYSFVVDVFCQMFGNNPDVELVLKLTVGQRPQINLPPNVKVVVGRFDQTHLIHLLHSCDCLLFPSNGEGFGLPPREAMATGMGCIYTQWGGLTDLAKLGVGNPVPPAGEQAAIVNERYLVLANNNSPRFGNFASQNTAAFTDNMLWAVQNRDQLLQKGFQDAALLRERETYADTVQKLSTILGLAE